MAGATTAGATREAFGVALAELGATNKNIVVVDGDVHNSTRTEIFMKKFPERSFNVGIAESNMVGVAAGLASCGKIAFVSSFATFIMSNAFDQLRMSVAFPNLNVKVVGTHAGISIGEDGPSQMGIEDVNLACALPNFTVVVPADCPSTRKLMKAIVEIDTPCYLRAGRPNVPDLYTDADEIVIGKANQLRDGKDLTIIAAGLMVAPALQAAEALAVAGVEARVLDMHTIKPLDNAAVLKAAQETGRILVAEEHLLHGGLGSCVAMSVVKQHPVPMRFVGIDDTFAESGTPDSLLQKYGLTAAHIADEARKLVGK